jgi:hypothetical protein
MILINPRLPSPDGFQNHTSFYEVQQSYKYLLYIKTVYRQFLMEKILYIYIYIFIQLSIVYNTKQLFLT